MISFQNSLFVFWLKNTIDLEIINEFMMRKVPGPVLKDPAKVKNIDPILIYPAAFDKVDIISIGLWRVQFVGVSMSPSLQVQPLRGPEQSIAHPKSSSGNPSSHSSGRTWIPSPQMEKHSLLVILDQFLHLQPLRGPLQVSLQPISSSSPSSHVSSPTRIPSPQISTQIVGEEGEPPEQFQPWIGPSRVSLHPQLSKTNPPSSQVSFPTTCPSQGIDPQNDLL